MSAQNLGVDAMITGVMVAIRLEYGRLGISGLRSTHIRKRQRPNWMIQMVVIVIDNDQS